MTQKIKIIVNLKITQFLKILENNIKSDLSRLTSYFDTNRLSINVIKGKYLQIGTYKYLAKMLNHIIHIKNEPLKMLSIATFLGMYIDENLK